jgi:hypothetical protein
VGAHTNAVQIWRHIVKGKAVPFWFSNSIDSLSADLTSWRIIIHTVRRRAGLRGRYLPVKSTDILYTWILKSTGLCEKHIDHKYFSKIKIRTPSCRKHERALCHDEVRILIFDGPTEDNWSQRPNPYLTRILVFLFDKITILPGYWVMFVNTKYYGHKTRIKPYTPTSSITHHDFWTPLHHASSAKIRYASCINFWWWHTSCIMNHNLFRAFGCGFGS